MNVDKKRFGEIAVSLGLVSEDKLREALAYQETQKSEGHFVRLGEALIRLGYIKPSDAFYIFQAQHAPRHQGDGRFLGQKLHGVQLNQFVGKGGMGEVYMGEHLDLGRKVAVKFLNPALAADEKYVERFLWEAQAAAKLDHPNIVHTYDIGAFKSTFYIIMQYLEGKSLATMIANGEYFAISTAINIICQAAQGLACAHKGNIIHRDIKPENLMISEHGHVKIMDFGLARSLEHYKGLTTTGQVMGTPEYISPEACCGEEIGPRADIYSLGITFYEILTGNPPFHSKPPVAVMLDHISTVPLSPDKANSHISLDLAKMVMVMIAKKPNDRYPDMDCVIEDLKRLEKHFLAKESQERVNKDHRSSGLYYFAKIIKQQSNNNASIYRHKELLVALLLASILLMIVVIWHQYQVQKKFSEFVRKENNLSSQERIRHWYRFLTRYPNGHYADMASHKLQLARETFFYEGVNKSAQRTKNPAVALQRWESYLSAYPAGRYVKVVQKHIEECQKRIPIFIEIETLPPGASFLVNGEVRGKTPCVISLIRSQSYVLHFYLKDHQPQMLKFSLVPPMQKKLLVKLQPIKPE